MIRYALACDHQHQFEGWFSSSADYDDQARRGLLACPMCGSGDVRKQIMAPAVAGTKAQASAAPAADPQPQVQAMMMEAMGQIRRHVENNFDYVGDAFAKEARAIHEGKSEDRGIYGEATSKQVRELKQDGIRVAPLPPEPPKKAEVN
jgi:hypothetical protein